MQRYKPYEPTQSVFICFSPEDHFPLGTFERFLVDVFSQIDFEESVEGPQCDQGGETPYDPRGVFGAIFYGFSKGIFSSRKLETACKQDVGFMYVSGFCTPDHSTFSRYISDRKEMITTIFAKVLFLADKQGYLDYRLIATDGTKVKCSQALVQPPCRWSFPSGQSAAHNALPRSRSPRGQLVARTAQTALPA